MREEDGATPREPATAESTLDKVIVFPGRLDRRALLRRGTALGVGIAGAGVLVRFGVAAQEGTATPEGVSATPSGSSTAQIVAAANAFLGTLSADEKSSVLFDFSNTEQRQRWSNLPEGGFERAGLMWGNLSQEPQDAWLALMQATLSAEGYTRVLAEWNADDALAAQDSGGGGGPQTSGTPPSGGGGRQNGGNPPSGGNGGPQNGGAQGGGGGQLQYGTQYYWIAIIGTPSESDPWQWQFGGHHVTVNATVAGDNLALTPSFIGVQPATYTDANGTTVRPLGDIEDEAFALVNSLDDTQRQAAILGDSYMDLVLGPGQDGKTLQPEGLPASQMTPDQQAAFLHLIGHYAGLGNETAAAARTAEVAAGIADTYLAWYGSTTQGDPAYFRVTGPAIVIEYSPQSMGGNAADHIHGIYRDPTNDYGAKYTGIELTS